jgi:hypothetical protein
MCAHHLDAPCYSYNNLKNKANVPLEKATFMKWIREINWLGAGTPAQELSDEELDQRLKYGKCPTRSLMSSCQQGSLVCLTAVLSL